jgi:hypothetical protein
MRIIESINRPGYLVSILKMNDKFIIKLEAGPYEQTYKVSEMDIGGLGNVKKLLTDEFYAKAEERFRQMNADFSVELAKHI